MAKTSYSLSHTKWMCKYHIIFTPKYRRKTIYYKIRRDLIEIFRHLCQYKGVEIIEGHMMPDHVHMLVLIPPKLSISDFMGYLKSKSALMIFDKHAKSEVYVNTSTATDRAILKVGKNFYRAMSGSEPDKYLLEKIDLHKTTDIEIVEVEK